MTEGTVGAARDIHFDLGFLGTPGQADYRLRAGRASYPLKAHTVSTLRAAGFAEGAVAAPTHFAATVANDAKVVRLMRVYGPPDASGFPTLAAIAVATPGDSGHYTAKDVARAVIFLNPSVTMLTPGHAETVLGHVTATDTLIQLEQAITFCGASWCTPEAVLDDHGKPVLRPDGKPFHTYTLNPGVLNSTTQVSIDAKTGIYSDPALEGGRWNLLPGVSCLDLSAPKPRLAVAAGAPTGGYKLDLEDAGPNFGLSLTLNSFKPDFTMDLTVTNSFVRHGSAFVTFLKADGTTKMIVPDNIWTELAKDALQAVVKEWLALTGDPNAQDFLDLLGGPSKNTLKFCGPISAESTFLGIPVSAENRHLTFTPPSDQGPVGEIRLVIGSLGVTSHSEWDPDAAWLGIAMTVLIDLAVPTYSLITGVGEESSTLFENIFESPGFLLSTAYSIFTVARDLFTGSENTGNDISAALISLSESLITKVLTSTEVIAKLAVYFGAEEVEEAIPFVGWAVKVLALEGAVAQLAQTIGEVIGSPRVVEFAFKVTMDARITLVPVTGETFPATATRYTVTAQYTGNTTRSYSGTIADPQTPSIRIDWSDVPVGGQVTFVVALFDQNGWGVGKGLSATVDNLINAKDEHGQGILAVTVAVEQSLYPLSADTRYLHSHLLAYGPNTGGTGYFWEKAGQAPAATRRDLGTGPTGHVLEALNGITLSDDLGILGYSWQASGLGIPPVGGDPSQTELFTLQNIGFKPIAGDGSPFWPQAGYMAAPAGYSKPPLLLYLRTLKVAGEKAAGGYFYLDPSGDSQSGFHLRAVKPVTDPAVPMGDASRRFDLTSGRSWGRFALLPTALAIHTNGYVVGVNPEYNSIQILRLPAADSPDAKAPWAFSAAGPGTGPGRVSAPTLTALRPDQTILVLEAGNQRIQAFSRGGHPVPAFNGIDTPYWTPLVARAPADTNVAYLSISVDVANYAFVLSQIGNGYDADDFWLDIYAPGGQHLAAQQGLNVAALAVDLWRNAYAVTFQAGQGPGGRTEPAISQYIPSTPKSN
ncbi:MAG: hypothetical protein PW843_30135 [Azospirillaceae bacterium]|nr:hypothetical protein [Azospirillaceae bacterium]